MRATLARTAALAAFATLFAGAAHAETYAACAWAKVTPAQKQGFVAAHHAGMPQGLAALEQMDAALRADFSACSRADVPELLAQGAMASEAITYAAAEELNAARHITRAQLDQAWAEAPETARQCARATAAQPFSLGIQPCQDPDPPLWFLNRFAVGPANQAVASQILFYYVSKAQGEWAQSLTEQFLKTPPSEGAKAG